MNATPSYLALRLERALQSSVVISGNAQLLRRRLSRVIPALEQKRLQDLGDIDMASRTLASHLVVMQEDARHESDRLIDSERRLSEIRHLRDTGQLEPPALADILDRQD